MAKTRFLYFGNQYIGEADETNAVTKRYVNEPDTYTNLIGQHDVASGNNSYHHYDAIGSTRSVTGDTETVTDTFTYDAWGNVLSRTGSSNIPFQYVGKHGYFRDEGTGTNYVMARNYDPRIIRWLTADPAGFVDGMNLYVAYFVPNTIDPSGMANNVRCKCWYSSGTLKRRYRYVDVECPSLKKKCCLDACNHNRCFGNCGWTGKAELLKDILSRVEVCHRRTNLCFCMDDVCALIGLYHYWIRTPNMEVGLGPAGADDVQAGIRDCFAGSTWNNHDGEGDKPGSFCIDLKDCDLKCVESNLILGQRKGFFLPRNNCNTVIVDLLRKCKCGDKEKWPPIDSRIPFPVV